MIGGSCTGLIGPASYECGEVAGNFDVKRRVVLFHSVGSPPSNLFLESEKEVQPWSWLSGQPMHAFGLEKS